MCFHGLKSQIVETLKGPTVKTKNRFKSRNSCAMNTMNNNRKLVSKRDIKQLFQGLRKESMSSISIISNDIEHSVSDSCSDNTTVIEVNNQHSDVKVPTVDPNASTSNTNKKRKRKNKFAPSKRFRRENDSLIIIDDQDDATRQSALRHMKTVECSTPIVKSHKQTLQDHIVSNFGNNNTTTAQNFNEDVENLTREINRDSYVTIDLTKGTLNNTSNDTNNVSNMNTVIDLVTLEDGELESTIDSTNHSNTTMTGDSDVTIVNLSRRKKEQKVHRYIQRIANLDASGTVLQSVMEKIYTGCNMVRSAATVTKTSPTSTQLPEAQSREDTYIKEVILGQKASRNSVGSNIYNPERRPPTSGPRMVVIDGSNVAMEHGKGRQFSVKGLKICIDYFLKKGHVVKAFVPRFRCRYGKSSNPKMLDELERRGLVVYTPSREIQGRLVTSYDDRYIVQCAAEFDGVIVSGDNYRDLMKENPRWLPVIENSLLPFTWVNDMIMFPRDPLGRHGPSLEQFLNHSKPTPKISNDQFTYDVSIRNFSGAPSKKS